jgi:hypothetical protein
MLLSSAPSPPDRGPRLPSGRDNDDGVTPDLIQGPCSAAPPGGRLHSPPVVYLARNGFGNSPQLSAWLTRRIALSVTMLRQPALT